MKRNVVPSSKPGGDLLLDADPRGDILLARAIGKLLGATFGAKQTDLPTSAREGLRFATLSHAGLAIGLVLSLEKSIPAVAQTISTIVLAAILIYELIGPVCTRIALVKSGESHPRKLDAMEVLE